MQQPGKSVAIVGVGGIFPQSPTLQHFWTNICANVNAARRPPAGRWLLSVDEVYDPAIGTIDKVYSEQACFVEQALEDLCLDGLDISGDFLNGLDPMFHLLLHAGLQAYRDGGAPAGSRAGVILGNLCLPSEKSSALARAYLGPTFEEQVFGRRMEPVEPVPDPVNRYVAGLPAAVLAKSLGLQGTCFTLDAACASSLYAIKLAVDELASGRADAMLAGGLSRPDSLYTQMGFSQLRALSPTGTCSPFDEKGNGLVVGEGCGMFLLKRTEDAVRDQDRIYGVIRGIGLSNDLGGSLLAPATEGQLRAMRAAYRQAGWAVDDVDLVECHATGTPVGDAVEFTSLQALWGNEDWKNGQCVIGSVKSNIGHLLTAAGSAALMKTVLALQEQTLPPTANFSRPSREIDFQSSPFRVLNLPQPWEPRNPGLPRRAAVSAFGFGGINAHLLVEEWQPAKPAKCSVTFPPSFQRPNRPVAIVGLGAEFGPWAGLQEFQYRVLGNSEEVPPQPPSNWWGVERSRWFEEAGHQPVDFKGHFIPEVTSVPGRFRIPPRELEEMLPRQLLMLKVAEQALSDAGLNKEDLLFTGVFLGSGLDLNATNFSFRWSLQKRVSAWAEQLGLDLTERQLADWLASLRESAGPALTANRVMGALGSIVASRIAKEFRIGGPSFTVSGEENSGMRALEVGLRALQEGSINRALVGAVDMAGDLRSVLGRHAVVPFSATGKAAPFDKQTDGGIIGEGAAAVILKRLKDAQQDGDRIYAVIRGLGSAVGGPGERPIPDREVYDLALTRTFQNTGIKPEEVSYLETEGCGRPEIDRMEADALGDFFGAEPNELPCHVGSVKSDIGHAGAAAGLASLVKATLCLDRQVIPRLRNVKAPRYEWVRGKRDFILPTGSQYWLRNRIDGPRKAVVSSLGADGSCCHALLEEHEGKTSRQTSPLTLRPLGPRREALFCLEADEVDGLLEKAARLERFVDEAGPMDMEALAARWLQAVPPEPARQRCVSLVAGGRDDLLAQLRQAVDSLEATPQQGFGTHGGTEQRPGVRDKSFYAPRPLGTAGSVAFIFPGSGNHFAGMGRELSIQWPQVFRNQDAKNQRLAKQFLPKHFWKQTLADSIHGDHNALVIGQVALDTAVSDLVRSFGIQPHAVSGYSLGESAGLFSLHAWTDRDEMLQRLENSSLFLDELAGECRSAARTWRLPAGRSIAWVLGLVDAPVEKVRAALEGLARVYLLIVNTYTECVVGGDRHQLDQLITRLGCNFLPLKGVTTVHCEVVKPVAEAYRELHLFPATPPEGIDFYSSARGEPYQVTDESAADVILEQALATVDYTRLVEKLYADGVRIFLEMGPGNSCSRMIGNILGDRPHLARSACSAGADAVSLLLRMLGECLAERVPVDLVALYPAELVPELEVPPAALIRTMIGGTGFPSVDLPQPEPVVRAAETASEPVPSSQPPARTRPEPAAAPAPTMTPDPVIAGFEQLRQESVDAHGAYLDFSTSLGQAISANMALQMELVEKLLAAGEKIPVSAGPTEAWETTPIGPASQSTLSASAVAAAANAEPVQQTDRPPAYDRAMCMEFAIGSIARMLGPEFSAIDRHPTRVRLPDEPLMLVDRIIEVEGEPRSLTSGRVITEHDVTADRWYLDGGRIPTCIAVEAGQADLFLTGYLGIDFVTRGLAVYRLLDAVVTFHRSLPAPGDVIRYDIKIDQFFRQDQTVLFRFNFEATVNGEPLLSMKNGCAGFFTAEELAAGRGIVNTRLDLQPLPGTLPEDWQELVPMHKETYDDGQITALYDGDLVACFGPVFGELGLQRPYTLPGARMKLVDRVVELDPKGGRYGLGLIRAEMDIHPDDWFLTCHFCDDNVMPGTLMYECCMHTLRIYLLRMGWVGEQGETWCEPVPGVDSGLKCRGQVIETTRTVTYQVSIKQLGYGPEPFAIGDALMFADGKPIVAIPDMSVRLAGLDREKVESLWGTQSAAVEEPSPPPSQDRRSPLYGYEKILAFSDGNPSAAFGEPYRIFDRERKIARLPRPPLQFLDRIVDVTGEPFKLAEGATCVAEYDVPGDAWYFKAERASRMPFAVLLETGLQPCGWLAAYLGSALTSDIDLKFRNLDGNAVQHRCVTPGSGTLTTKVTITRISRSGGMIIQAYDFEISDRQGPVYTGNTVFGFFSAESLAQQVGVRGVQPYQPAEAEVKRAKRFDFPQQEPFPAAQLRMIDTIELFIADGGPHQLGFIRGSKRVDPTEWFFQAHFYQDPVCPGSLGLESFQQLLKVVAAERWGVHAETRFASPAQGERHIWNYRGQIVPENDEISVEAVVTEVDDARRLIRADGLLTVDGRTIYRMEGFTLRLV